MYPPLPSERAGYVAQISPQDGAATARNSDAVDMSKFHSAIFLAISGALTGTMDAKLEESNVSDFSSGVTDITGKAITQFAATDDNKVAIINLRSAEMTKKFARLKITPTGGTTNLLAGVGLGMDSRFGPASDDDLAAVLEIVK